MKGKQVPIIDLFAGPGGLGEGFTSFVDEKNERVFKIALSIERNEFAHKTLTLRSFLRQFPYKQFPEEYYQFVRGEIKDVEDLYKLYPVQSEKAKKETWKFSLGDAKDYKLLDKKIREALEGAKKFVLIGGPPCQAYSLVGRARRQEKEGLKKDDERVYLYREYYRILAVHQPSVFIMENVKGLLSSKVEDELVFTQLLNDLKNPVESYRKLHGNRKIPKSKYRYKIYSVVKRSQTKDLFGEIAEPFDYIIKSELYGIPQTRHRVILLGIREDIEIVPGLLKSEKKFIGVERILSGLPRLRSGLSKIKDGKMEWKEAVSSIKQKHLQKGIDKEVWKKIEFIIENLSVPTKDRGGEFVEYDAKTEYNSEWYLDNRLQGVCNHQTRSHIIEDLHRYLFASCYAQLKRTSPMLRNFPFFLLPNHKNAGSGDFGNRFKVQVEGLPSKTITSHISKDGHYFIHPDASQCRSLTVREAARIQTFPDNYYFCGPRTEQFHQVGNAVPPLLAKQIARVIENVLQTIKQQV